MGVVPASVLLCRTKFDPNPAKSSNTQGESGRRHPNLSGLQTRRTARKRHGGCRQGASNEDSEPGKLDVRWHFIQTVALPGCWVFDLCSCNYETRLLFVVDFSLIIWPRESLVSEKDEFLHTPYSVYSFILIFLFFKHNYFRSFLGFQYIFQCQVPCPSSSAWRSFLKSGGPNLVCRLSGGWLKTPTGWACWCSSWWVLAMLPETSKASGNHGFCLTPCFLGPGSGKRSSFEFRAPEARREASSLTRIACGWLIVMWTSGFFLFFVVW